MEFLLLQTIVSGGLISFLIALLVLAIIIYAIHLLIGFLGLDPRIAQFVYLIIAVIVIVYLLNRFLGVSI